VVVADNVKFPGAPDYREHMTAHEGKDWRTKEHETHVEYQSLIKFGARVRVPRRGVAPLAPFRLEAVVITAALGRPMLVASRVSRGRRLVPTATSNERAQ